MPEAKRQEVVHVVFGGKIVLAAYRGGFAESAEMHARCVTGATVVTVELLERVPREIISDLDIEYSGQEDDETPVTPRTMTLEDLDDHEP